jgi:tetratricopeptide (TPR) repeat protein
VSRALTIPALVILLHAGATSAAAQDEADLAWRRGDIETARRLYAEQLASDSTDERALHRMALILGWNNQYEVSIELFDKLLAMSPRNWEAAVDRARVFAWRGDTDRAIQLLDGVLERQPAYVPALRARAQFQSWAGEYGAALSTYEQIGQVLPEDRTIPRERARVLSWASRLDAAIAIYDSLLRVDRDDREALLGLAQALAWGDRLDSATVIYRGILAQDSTDLAALRGVAQALSWSGDLVTGERFWRRAIAGDSDNVAALVGLASNLRWQGRNAAAFEVLQRAEALAPANRDVLSEKQWLRPAVAPQAGVAIVYENDSDGNRITSLAVRSAWHQLKRLELTGSAYVRGLGVSGPNGLDQRAYGARVEGLAQIDPGWSLVLGLGLSGSDVSKSGSEPSVNGRITSPSRHNVVGSLSYLHEPLDASAELTRNQVTIDMLSLDLRATPSGGWRISLSGSYARFVGSDPNSRWAAYASVSKRLSTQITVGGSFRSFGFDKNLNDGYFDPDRYLLSEMNFRWQQTFGRWRPSVELAPGLQQVGVAGSVSGSGRARVAIGFRVLPGREFEVSGGYSTTGLSVFGSDVGDYRYRSLRFSTNWVF